MMTMLIYATNTYLTDQLIQLLYKTNANFLVYKQANIKSNKHKYFYFKLFMFAQKIVKIYYKARTSKISYLYKVFFLAFIIDNIKIIKLKFYFERFT